MLWYCLLLGCTRYFFLAVFLDFGDWSSTFRRFPSLLVGVFLLGMFERFLIVFLGRVGDGFGVFHPADPPAQCRGWSR